MPDQDQQIEELIENNDELENYFKNTIIPQLFVDANLKLKKFTPPAMKQFTLTNNDLDRSLSDIKDNFRFPSIVEDVKLVIECNEILEKEIQTTDSRWYQMNVIPYVDFKNHKTNGVIITFVEITSRIEDLKEQERLISDHETLLDTISHDIKNPLTSLVLSIELFKNVAPEDPRQFHPLLKILESSIRKMQDIIGELTDTRKEQHRYRAVEEKLIIPGILEEVRLTIMDSILESGAVIKFDLNITEIIFSKRKLRSIMYNLISNAIKFRSPDRKPEILVKTFLEGEFIVISVSDNGIGIYPGQEEEIFSKYFRLEHHIEGSGIGLYLVQELVNSSGGKILLNSEPGNGSEFKIYLKAS